MTKSWPPCYTLRHLCLMNNPTNPLKENIRIDAIVEEALPGSLFRLKTREGKEILGHLAGKMRMNHIRILLGDRVTVEMTPYDDKRGRIVRRL